MSIGNSINEQTTGICGFTGIAFTGTAVTNHAVIIGGSTSSTLSNVGPTATAGQILQSAGSLSDPVFSTATYPSTAGTVGNFLVSDGTNMVSTAVGNLTYVKITLTNSQIKSLHASPVQIVAAPGSGKVILPFNVIGKFIYGGNNAFTAGLGQTISIYYGTTQASSTAVLNNGAITGTNSVYGSVALVNFTAIPIANIENMALNAYVSVATEISGNAANDNTIALSLLYTVISLP